VPTASVPLSIELGLHRQKLFTDAASLEYKMLARPYTIGDIST